ncbi:MAG: helix-turn-helix transcriptional regulator [Leadbetterella sp.]|nr:helix-turn-helix transcriptional regulator [Leadbetterella sp.]
MNILRLKELLSEKGVSGKELADKIGVTPTTISNIAQGNNFPKPETLIAIASALDVDVKDLFVSTKEAVELEPFYIKRNGELVQIGEINIRKPL